jgi:hypothetical protein
MAILAPLIRKPAEMLLLPVAVTGFSLMLLAAASRPVAQELEPRAYANAPIGSKVLALGYARSNGNILLDPALPIENLDADLHLAFMQLSHSFSVAQRNAKVKVLLPFASGDWLGAIEGIAEDQSQVGMGDAWVGFDWLYAGAPALSREEFAAYRPQRVLGAGLRFSVPTGDYNPADLVNLGSNRWTVRAELAASQTWGQWTLEGVGGVRVFGDNNEFLLDKTLKQAPLYFVKGSMIRSLDRPGWWWGLGLAYGEGGRTKVDGVPRNTEQKNWRFGAVFALPLAANHGLGLRINSGVNDGVGGDFDSISVVYTYQSPGKSVE